MFRTMTTGLMVLGASTALLLAGCASGGSPGAAGRATAGPSTQAVACSKCKVTYVKVPTNDAKGRFVGYTNRQTMECPGCKTAVENFFQTGKLQHACTHCEGTMEVCNSHS